jgi:hypothetical protein
LSSSVVSASNFTGSAAVFNTLQTKGLTTIGDAAADSIVFNASNASVPTVLSFASDLLYLNNTNNKVAINQASTSANDSTFTVNGSVAGNVTSYSTSKPIAVDDCFINVGVSGITLTLPPINANSFGRIYTITAVSKSGAFTVAAASGQFINFKGDNTNTLTFNPGVAGSLVSAQLCCQEFDGSYGTPIAPGAWVVISAILK